MWREQRDLFSTEESLDLILITPDRRGRSDDLGRDWFLAPSVGAQLVDDRLVQADHGAEWAGDEVQLVLDDQARRRDFALTLIIEPEQVPGFGAPGHHGELVDGADHDRGAHHVDVFIDDVDGQPGTAGVPAL